MSNDDLINVTQAAEILNVSPRTIQYRIKAGALPAKQLGPGTSQYVLQRADVEAAKVAATAKAAS